MLFMVRSTVDLVLTQENAPLSSTSALLELPSFKADRSQKSVPPPPHWFNHDASVMIPRSPPWPDWFNHDASVMIPRSPPWPDWGFVMWFNQLCLFCWLPLHFFGDEWFQAGRMMWKANGPDLEDLGFNWVCLGRSDWDLMLSIIARIVSYILPCSGLWDFIIMMMKISISYLLWIRSPWIES